MFNPPVEKVEVAVVLVALKKPRFNKGKVEEAVQVLELARLREATTAPVVGEIVKVESELETEVTAPPIQLPEASTIQPEVSLMPLAKVEVPTPPMTMTPEVSRTPAVVVDIPTPNPPVR